MSEIQPLSLAIGALLSIVVAIVGRLSWRLIEGHLNGSPDLIWFVSHESSYRIGGDIERFWDELVSDDLPPDLFLSKRERWRELKEYTSACGEVVSFVLHNLGNAHANDVSVLLANNPISISIYPDAYTIKQDAADGKVILKISGINRRDQVRIIFWGLRATDVRAVSYEKGSARKYYGDRLVSMDYVTGQLARRSRIWVQAFLVVTLTLLISSLLSIGISE